MVTLMTSREFNQKTSAAKRAASRGPVVVTDRGQPEHVLLTYETYLTMTGGATTVAEAFAALPDTQGIDVDFPRSDELPRVAVFD